MGRKEVATGVNEGLAVMTAWLNRDPDLVDELIAGSTDTRRMVLALTCLGEALLITLAELRGVEVESLWRAQCGGMSELLSSWERE